MKIHTNINDLPTFKNAVITIGSFDGVHLGHQFILEKIKQLAAENNGESVVITFHPHPRQVLAQPDNRFRILTSVAEKQQLLADLGINHLVVIPFSTDFSEQSPEAYIESFLVKHFQPQKIVIGYDHRFGKDRVGDIDYLKKYAQRYDYEVIEIQKQEIDDLIISSTKIRNALENGDLIDANLLLGYNYKLNGMVVKGDQIGRTIGFPTANIAHVDALKLVPKVGIYAARIFVKNEWHNGMLYIGNRPTVSGTKDLRIEINIFDFKADIYGENVTIEFVERTRNDQKFDGLPALVAALKNDEIVTKVVFEKQKKSNLPRIALVILNFNGRQYLEQFLPSVLQFSAIAEVIIADNASTDDSILFLKSVYPELPIIQLDSNLGYAGGYNEALKHLKSDYYILLNSDIEVRSAWIEPMLACLENDKTIAACQPKILSFKDNTSFEHAGASGGMMDIFAYPLCRGRLFYDTEKDTGQYDDETHIFWASGAAMFIRADVFHAFGGFDAAHFAHQEEIDLCWRLQRAGFGIKVVPSAVVYHVGGGTLDYNSPFKTYLNFRNSLMMILKNETVPNLIWLIPLRLVLDGVAGFMFLMKGQFQNFLNVIKAHFWVYFHIFSILEKRKLYQNLIDKHHIGASNIQGKINKSIVYQYFINKKRKYNEL